MLCSSLFFFNILIAFRICAVVTMSDYLKKPTLRPFVTIEKGDKFREGEQQTMHLSRPLLSNADVPNKTPEMEKVEVPNPKVLDAKDKKKVAAGKGGKPSGGVGGSRVPTQKRAGGDIASLLRKKQKPADDVSVVDLDASEGVHSPDPITSIPPKGAGKKGGVAAAAGAGMFIIYFFYFPYFFPSFYSFSHHHLYILLLKVVRVRLLPIRGSMLLRLRRMWILRRIPPMKCSFPSGR